MPRLKTVVQKKPVSIRMETDVYEWAEDLAFHEFSTENPRQSPTDVNMSEWFRAVILDYLENSTDAAGGREVLARKRREAEAQVARDRLAALEPSLP